MKFLNINAIKGILPVLLMVFAFSACEDPDKAPIVTFDSAGKGAYPRLVADSETGGKLINILTEGDFTSSTYGYAIEFVDGQGGQRVTQFILNATYDDATGANSQGPIELLAVDASQFSPNSDGFLQVSVELSGPTLASAFGLSYADLNPGDEFIMEGNLVTADGTFASSNSSATVNGSAFQAQFDVIMPAGCPSDLTGTYAYTTSNTFCGAPTSGEVTIIAQGGGSYVFDDWSLGAYNVCYGGFEPASWGSLQFTDVCEVVNFTGFVDGYGDRWTFNSSVSGESWTINWTNTYGESGNTVITWPGGVPFTMGN